MLQIHAAIICALHLPAVIAVVGLSCGGLGMRRACYGRKPLLRSASPADELLACCCGGSFRGRSLRSRAAAQRSRARGKMVPHFATDGQKDGQTPIKGLRAGTSPYLTEGGAQR